jgi:hypothetical protein
MHFKLLCAYTWPLWALPSAVLAFTMGASWLSVVIGRWPHAFAWFALVMLGLLLAVLVKIYEWAVETIRDHRRLNGRH